MALRSALSVDWAVSGGKISNSFSPSPFLCSPPFLVATTYTTWGCGGGGVFAELLCYYWVCLIVCWLYPVRVCYFLYRSNEMLTSVFFVLMLPFMSRLSFESAGPCFTLSCLDDCCGFFGSSLVLMCKIYPMMWGFLPSQWQGGDNHPYPLRRVCCFQLGAFFSFDGASSRLNWHFSFHQVSFNLHFWESPVGGLWLGTTFSSEPHFHHRHRRLYHLGQRIIRRESY